MPMHDVNIWAEKWNQVMSQTLSVGIKQVDYSLQFKIG